SEAGYIPLGHRGGTDLMAAAPEQIPLEDALAALKPMLEDPSVLKVGHNRKRELAVLSRYGIALAPIDDAMLISYLVAGGLRGHGVDELSELLLDLRLIDLKDVVGSGKALRSFADAELRQATACAAERADVGLRLWRLL